MRSIYSLVVAGLIAVSLHAQQAPSTANLPVDPPHHDWHASWVTHPTAPLRDPVVLHFRRVVTLGAVPPSYIVRVSADNRFVLFVNGSRVGDGPARGDLPHWRYEKFDLAPFLHTGLNYVNATVWNFGVYAPLAQFTDRTAFLLESEATGDRSLSTPQGWMVEEEPGQMPLGRNTVSFQAYMASGPGEQIDAARYDWNWNKAPGDDPSGLWVPVTSPLRDSIYSGVNRAHSADTTGDNSWSLVPDTLPHMEYSPTSAGDCVRTAIPALSAFPGASVSVPAGTHVHILLDRKTLTTAYPLLTVSGGKGTHITLTYSEALYDKEGHKGDRNDVGDRTARGLTDIFLPDGGEHRTFEPLWWRTWRYLDLDIQTADQPLQLESMTAFFTAYPFQELATLQAADPQLQQIWDISWRTARLDAHETYMDTPYYEQLQYIGDTRIQALISYAVAGDDRLARQALEAFNQSRIPDGITQSRYPSSLRQMIPTFSLLWIGMVRDYWMYRPDPGPAIASMDGTRTVLNWFAHYEQPDGLLRQVPWWSFIDWVPSGTIPTYDAKDESCVTTLQYLGAMEDAAALEQGLGDPVSVSRYQDRAAYVRAGLQKLCWNPVRGLVADTPDQKVFSQQANILGVLYDIVPKDQQQEVLHKMLAIQPGSKPEDELSASYYFRFYLARALVHAGMGDEYIDSIKPWRDLLALHFSTWPEVPGDTRSDSHAWSAHPIYDLLTVVAGIAPGSPGFATVRIAPNLGPLKELTATYPHPQGMIRVEYHREWSGLHASVNLPGTLSGTLVFHGKEAPLHPGINEVDMK